MALVGVWHPYRETNEVPVSELDLDEQSLGDSRRPSLLDHSRPRSHGWPQVTTSPRPQS